MMNPFPYKYSSQIEIDDYDSFYNGLLKHTEGNHRRSINEKAKFELKGDKMSFYLAWLRDFDKAGPNIYCNYDPSNKILEVKIGFKKIWLLILLFFSLFIAGSQIYNDFSWLAAIRALIVVVFFYFGSLLMIWSSFNKVKKAAVSLSNYPGVKK